MPFRDTHPRRFTPEGLTDAVDGSDAFKGAMSMLVNLIRQANSRGIVVPRPAATLVAMLPDYGGGPVTLIEQTGDLFYGFYASLAFPGKDRPYYYDAVANVFRTIDGMTTANLPDSPPQTGPWTPPTAAQVAGRIMFTHPGFSNAPLTPGQGSQLIANTTSGSPVVISQITTIAAGGTISGPNITSGTTVLSVVQMSQTSNGTPAPSGSGGQNTFSFASVVGLAPKAGMTITGYGGADGVTGVILDVTGSTITYTGINPATFSGGEVLWYGSQITMSANATGTSGSSGEMIALTAPMSIEATVKFGWLDITGLVIMLSGTLTSGSPIVIMSDTTGVQSGQSVTGTGIPADTSVVSVSIPSFSIAGQTNPNTGFLTLLYTGGPFTLPFVGQSVTGPGVPIGSVVSAPPTILQQTNVSALILVQISHVTSATPASGTYLFTGGQAVLLSNPATADGPQTLTFTGGTPTAPRWAAGDMDIHPLASIPVFVAAFNSRAWFGVNTPIAAGVQASDAGFPTQQSNANQTLFFNGAVPVNAAAGLPLSTQLGGIIQALMVFQGDTNIQQITGDFAFGNISVNTLPVATGTLSPRSIASTNKGLLFSASDGLRLIDFNAAVTDPLGIDGKGISVPFVNAAEPSRIEAAFDDDIYRVTIYWQPPRSLGHIWGDSLRTDEFWLHFTSGRWSGPHTLLLDAVAPWPGRSSFLAAPTQARGFFYQSDPQPRASSTYDEFGETLSCVYQTDLLPDNPEQMAISVVETSLFVGLVSGSGELLVTATDDMGQVLDQTYVWIGPFSRPAQRAVPWHGPLVFRQMMLRVDAGATPALQLGTLALQTHVLGYQMPYPITPEFILGASPLGGGDVLGP